MTYGSVCSGIEAASMAWHGLGWTMCMTCEGLGRYQGHDCGLCAGHGMTGGWEPSWFSEIEPFPSAVLAHRYPSVPNLGDMTKLPERIRSGEVAAPDLLVGGTPCQAFSIAGLRQSLDDARGNLTLTFLEIADAIGDVRRAAGKDEPIIVWENVPGVLSTKDNAFGCFLGGLAGADGPLEIEGGKWGRAGVVNGPRRRVAWCILDAQFFGVAQRRRRVFVVAVPSELGDRLGDSAHPAEILSIGQGLRGDTPTRGTAGFEATRGAAHCADVSTVDASYKVDRGGSQHLDRLIVKGFEPRSPDGIARISGDIAPTLNRMGDGQREPCVFMVMASGHANAKITEDFAPKLNCAHEQPILLEDQGGSVMNVNATGVDGTLRRDTHGHEPILLTMREGCEGGGKGPLLQVDRSAALATANSQVLFTAAIPISTMAAVSRHGDDRIGLGIGRPGDPSATLSKAHSHAVSYGMQVRRLTPRECERLQGFPDDYTAIPYKGKPASDGPRYKALGNSMAVPVMRWIGWRIQTVGNSKKL